MCLVSNQWTSSRCFMFCCVDASWCWTVILSAFVLPSLVLTDTQTPCVCWESSNSIHLHPSHHPLCLSLSLSVCCLCLSLGAALKTVSCREKVRRLHRMMFNILTGQISLSWCVMDTHKQFFFPLQQPELSHILTSVCFLMRTNLFFFVLNQLNAHFPETVHRLCWLIITDDFRPVMLKYFGCKAQS